MTISHVFGRRDRWCLAPIFPRDLMRWVLVTAVIVATCIAAPRLWAAEGAGESRPRSNDAEEEMLALNRAGFEAFKNEKFAKAAAKFERAYTYVADPILLKNAAIAWFKAGRCAEARPAAVSFLMSDEASPKDRTEARSVVGHCRLAEAQRAIDDGELDQARTAVEEVQHLHTDQRVQRRLDATRRHLMAARASQAGNPRAEAGWMLVGAGAAVVVGNIAYQVLADQRRSQRDTADWLVPSLYAFGAATTATGVWLVVSADTPAPPNQVGPNNSKPAALRRPASGVRVGLNVKF